MPEKNLPQLEQYIPPLIRVPISLNKYYQCVQNAGLIQEAPTQTSDEMVHTIYNYADPDERVELIINEYSHQSIIRPDLYIPLIVESYKNPLLFDGLLQFDPHIRSNIFGSANCIKAELETEQAKFSLGVSLLNELDQDNATIALRLLTTHIAYLHNLNVELLSDR